jgi:hypothetical protein
MEVENGDFDDVRDLVEPVARPKIHEVITAPLNRNPALRWIIAAMDDDGGDEDEGDDEDEEEEDVEEEEEEEEEFEESEEDEGDEEEDDDDVDDDHEDEDNRRLIAANRFYEFQLIGSGAAGGGGGNENEAALGCDVPSWMNADDVGGGCGGDAAERFRSFLCKDRPHATVVWLSPYHFVACDGPYPNSRTVYLSWPVLELFATVTMNDGGYRLLFFGIIVGSSEDQDRRLRTEAEVAWMPAVGALVARSPLVTKITCVLDVGRHLAFLEALVSPAPPPEGRTLRLGQFGDGTEAAARIVATRTHPDTALDINVHHWGSANVAVLAEALRTNRCPKGLILMEATKLGMVEPLANALRIATSLEELELDLSNGWTNPENQRRSRQLLDAIGDNVGLRKLTLYLDSSNYASGFVREFWTSVLRNRTITTVSVVTNIQSGNRPSLAALREVSLHVVQLLRSNRVLTDLQFPPGMLDPDIMDAQAVPVLQLNRLRAAAGDINRWLGAFLRSDPVRRHPMLRYHLLRGNVSTLVRQLRNSSSTSTPTSREMTAAEDSDQTLGR